MSIRTMILEARRAITRANYHSNGQTIRLTTVYLGHKEYAQFVTDPENRGQLYGGIHDPYSQKFGDVEVIEVCKPSHVGFAWSDDRVLP